MNITKIRSLFAARRIKLAVSTFVLAVTAATFVAGPFTSQASAAVSDCWATRFCVWMDPNFVNVRATWGDAASTCYNLAAAYNNNVSSAHNMSATKSVYVYDGFNCTGDNVALLPGDYCADFDQDTYVCGSWFLERNEISSIKFL